MEPGDPVTIFRSHEHEITSLGFCSYDEREFLISGDCEGTLKMWDISLRRLLFSVDAHSSNILTIHQLTSQTGCTVLTHCREGYVKIWDFEAFMPRSVYDIALQRTQGALKMLQGVQSKQFIDIEPFATECFGSSVFCSAAVLDNESTICVYSEPAGGLFLFPIEYLSDKDDTKLTIVPFSKFGLDKFGMCMSISFLGTTHVVIGMENGSMFFYDIGLDKVIHKRNVSTQPVLHVSVNGSKLVTCTADKRFRMFTVNLEDREVELVGQVNNVATSQADIRDDGKIVATCGWDSKIRVFLMADLTQIAHLDCHRKSLSTIRFNKCDGTFAAAGKDKIVSYFDMYADK